MVAELQSEVLLKQLLNFIKGFKQLPTNNKKQTKQENPLSVARTFTPASVSLEILKKEQGYSMGKLNQVYTLLDHSIWEEEDIGQLLKTI